MMLPMPPEARRCIHMKKPMSSTTGSSSGMRVLQMLSVGVEYSTPFSVNSAWSASVGLSGPVVEKWVPSSRVPEMWPLALSKVADFT